MEKYRLIILDLDDTLFDHEFTERNAVAYACANQNIAFDSNIFLLYKKANYLAKKNVKDYLFDPQNFRKTRIEFFFNLLGLINYNATKFLEDYLIHSKQGILLDGVEETLRNIKTTKVVATNGSNQPRLDKMRNSSISSLIADFYSSERLGVAKPDKRFYQLILEDKATPHKESIVVGDKYETDIIPAIDLGLDACWFNWKKQDESDISPKVKVIHKFDELINITEQRG